MKCPFELPVKISSELDDDGLYCVRTGNKKLLFDAATKKEADYIVQAINSHEKFKSTLEQHRWIPVSERLPEQTGYYLIICASEGYNEHRWWQFWYQDGWYEYSKIEDCIEDTERTVTHWKPIILPEQALEAEKQK